MTPIEIQDFKEKTEQETVDNIIRTIEVNDSYFYAKMIVSEVDMAEDPLSEKVRVYIKMHLFNSNDFENTSVISPMRTEIVARPIVKNIIIDRSELIDNKADAMMLVYKVVSEQITQELFHRNADKINWVIDERKRMYI